MRIQHQSKQKMEIPGIGETDDNGIIDVTDEQAGRPPDPRVDELMDAVNASDDHFERLALKDEWVGLDKGSGLLAQETWKPYGTKAKAALKQEDDK